MKHYRPQKIFLEHSVAELAVSRRVLRRLPGLPVEMIESSEELLDAATRSRPSATGAKRALVLARHKGAFFKPCPASQTRGDERNVCCNYFVVNYASNCHMQCSYCYLQSYLNFPHLVVYANSDDLLSELDEVFRARPGSFFRVGTGELADSLALDPLTGYGKLLVEFFASRRNAVLEFKTKTDCVDGLLGLRHGGRTVVSWSINPRFIQQREEHGTATIEERLSAAERCVDAGYRVAFHLDPLIYYPEWERGYRSLVDEIFDRIPADSIPWISVGVLRMTSPLKDVIRDRFPASLIHLGETVAAPDGKQRYIKALRLELYHKVVGWIRHRAAPTTGLYACMERPEVWSRVFSRPIPTDEQVGNEVTSSWQSA